ncbi:hypothetical protein GOP47_0009309 [Adiantum capillus-veneris]|uniref:RING-type domain-containing protein n=1 Tax=Adiantum capillus-veneris TaxID=13818 RepID=A0A9D4ZH29_ADICA|nr:hypothetical protein GOP47_0009309 [Adiantum capillus-veneris]
MFIAAAVLSRRRLPPSRSPPSPPPAARHPHHHRHRDPHRRCASEIPSRPHHKPAQKLPRVIQTTARATGLNYNSRDTSSESSEDAAYASAMAARARLHTRLRAGAPLVTQILRSSSSSAWVRQEEFGPCKFAKKSIGSSSSTVHTQHTTRKFSGSKIDKWLPKKLVCFKTCKEADEDLHSEPDVCSICLESLSMGNTVLCFPCKHRFHRNCLVSWLEAHWQCPNCRSIITKVGVFQVSVEYFNALYSPHNEGISLKEKARTQVLMN